jgi:hypothetical protein
MDPTNDETYEYLGILRSNSATWGKGGEGEAKGRGKVDSRKGFRPRALVGRSIHRGREGTLLFDYSGCKQPGGWNCLGECWKPEHESRSNQRGVSHRPQFGLPFRIELMVNPQTLGVNL